MLKVRHLERFSFGGAFDAAAANALDADAHALHGAAHFHLNALQVGVEAPPADAGDFAADATQVFRFAAPGDLMSQARSLTANVALQWHDTSLSKETFHSLWKN
jgi:hypothetical protein